MRDLGAQNGYLTTQAFEAEIDRLEQELIGFQLPEREQSKDRGKLRPALAALGGAALIVAAFGATNHLPL